MGATYLGVDIGSSVVKAVLFDAEGDALAVAKRPMDLVHVPGGGVEQSVEQMLERLGAVLREVSEPAAAEPPVLLALTGQGDGCWLVDERGEPVRPAVSWMDGRGASQLERWRREGTAGALYRVNGNALFPGASCCILRWLGEEEPEAMARAAYALSCKDVAFRALTGEVATDPSEASLPFGDPDLGGYHPELLELLGLAARRSLLPPVRQPLPSAPLLAEAARWSGLGAGTPVTSGPFDLAACVVGAGISRPGDGLLVIGTTLACEVLVDGLDRSGEAAGMHLATGVPGRFVRSLPAMAGTASLDWLLHLLGMTVGGLEKALGESPVGARGVRVLPYLAPSGERAPFVDPGARGQLSGVRLDTGPADLVRAMCEGIAFAARDCFERARLSGELFACGGGARSPAWLQVFADVLDRPLHLARSPEVGARGAVLAGLAAIRQATPEATPETVDPAAWTAPEGVVSPRPEASRRYEELFAEYRHLQADARRAWARA